MRSILTIACSILCLAASAQLGGWTVKGGALISKQDRAVFGTDSNGTYTSFAAYGAKEMHFGYANSVGFELGYRNRRISVPELWVAPEDTLVSSEFSSLSIGFQYRFWIVNFLAVNRMHQAKCADKDHMIYGVTFKPWLTLGFTYDFMMGRSTVESNLEDYTVAKNTSDFYVGIGANLLEFPDNYDPMILFIEARMYQTMSNIINHQDHEKVRTNGFEILLGLKFSKDAKKAFQGWD